MVGDDPAAVAADSAYTLGYAEGHADALRFARADALDYVARWAHYYYPATGPETLSILVADLVGLAYRERQRKTESLPTTPTGST